MPPEPPASRVSPGPEATETGRVTSVRAGPIRRQSAAMRARSGGKRGGCRRFGPRLARSDGRSGPPGLGTRPEIEVTSVRAMVVSGPNRRRAAAIRARSGGNGVGDVGLGRGRPEPRARRAHLGSEPGRRSRVPSVRVAVAHDPNRRQTAAIHARTSAGAGWVTSVRVAVAHGPNRRQVGSHPARKWRKRGG